MTDAVAFAELRNKVTALEKNVAVMEANYDTIDKRLEAIEDTLKWLVRLVIGGLIMAVIGFAISGGLSIG